MTDLFCAALLLTALMLIWPQPLHVTIKRALPILLVMAVAIGIVFLVQVDKERTITIRALDQRRDAAEGSEIWIKSVVVDGVEHSPEEVYSSLRTWHGGHKSQYMLGKTDA